MGQVVVTLSGDEQRLLRSLDRVIAKERELAQSGKDAGESHARSNKDALGSIQDLLGGYTAWGAALALVKAGLDQVADAQERASKARDAAAGRTQTDAGGLRELAQVSGGDKARYAKLTSEARAIASSSGVSVGIASGQVAALERAGVTGEGRSELVSDLGKANIDPKVLIAAAALQKTFGGKTDAQSLRGLVGGSLGLQQPGDLGAFLEAAAGNAGLAKKRGLDESTYLGELAKVSQQAGSVEKGSHQMRALFEHSKEARVARNALAGGFDRPDLTNGNTLRDIVATSETDPTVLAANANLAANAKNNASLEEEGRKRLWANTAITDREMKQRLAGGGEEAVQNNKANAEAELQGRSLANPMRYIDAARHAVYGDMLEKDGDAIGARGAEDAGQKMRDAAMAKAADALDKIARNLLPPNVGLGGKDK